MVIIEGLLYGTPNSSANDYVGFVNGPGTPSNPTGYWQGRPPGSWLIEEFTTTTSPYQSYYSFRFVAVGNILGRPWITSVRLYDPKTGQYVDVDQTYLDAIPTLEYEYGELGAFGELHTGMQVIGPYPMVNFLAIGIP